MWISQFVACKDCSKLYKPCMWISHCDACRDSSKCLASIRWTAICDACQAMTVDSYFLKKRKPGSRKSRSWLQVDKQYFFGITMMATSLQATNCGDTIQLVRGQTPPNTPYRNISRLGAKVYIWHRKCRLQGSFLPLVISAAFP